MDSLIIFEFETIPVTKLFLILYGILLSFTSLAQYSKEVSDVFYMANRKFALQQYDSAVIYYTKAIKLEPKMKEAYKNRGRCYTLLRRNPMALTDFTEAIKLDSNDYETFNFRGFTSAELGHTTRDSAFFRKSLEDMRHSIRLDSTHAETYENLAIIYMWLNDYDMSLWAMQKTINLDPRNAKAYYDAGVLLNKMGNTSDACKMWNLAAQLYYPLVTQELLDSCKQREEELAQRALKDAEEKAAQEDSDSVSTPESETLSNEE